MYERIYPLVGRERSLPIYLTGAGCEEPQNRIGRPQGLGDFQVLWGVRGSGTLECAGHSYTVPMGTAFLLLPETPHEYAPADGGWETDWCTFGGFAARGFAEGLGLAPGSPFPIAGPAGLDSLLKELMHAARAGGTEAGRRCSALTYSLLTAVAENRARAQNVDTAAPIRLGPALSLISRAYRMPLSLSDLSAAAGVTPQYLCRLFRRALGMRPTAYLTLRRVQASKKLLAETALPVYEVASRTGFSSSNYFCAVFRKSEGISPEEFRRRHRSI